MMWTTRPRSEFGALAAIREGTGAPVLLLHGVGLRAEAWNAQIDALARAFAVIAPDMPGHGESPVFDHSPTLQDYVDRVAAALDRPAWVAGHSMGALIALALAIRFPDRVRGVAALNAIYRRTPKASDAVRRRAAALNGRTPADPKGTLQRWFGGAASPEETACRAWLSAADPRSYKQAYAVFAEADGPADDDLRALAPPALFLTGSAEPNSTPAMSHAMADLTPNGAAQIIDGAAHMVPMTHAPAVSAALMAFFEERRS